MQSTRLNERILIKMVPKQRAELESSGKRTRRMTLIVWKYKNMFDIILLHVLCLIFEFFGMFEAGS